MEFVEHLKGLGERTIIKLWNEFCCDTGDESKYIFDGIWDMGYASRSIFALWI